MKVVRCFECGQRHPAEFSHVSQHGGQDVYAVVCDVDGLTDYYTAEVVEDVEGEDQ